MNDKKKNILVTGANGQLGSELRNLASTSRNLNFIFTDIAELDITDQNQICHTIESEDIDTVVNCAAFTAVDKAEDNLQLATKLNAEAPEKLARAINEKHGTMIHISTDYVFDGLNHSPYSEGDTPNPQSVYGKTKAEGEQRVMRACERSIVVRTAWLYSPYGNNFVKTMMRLGREREELNVVFDQIGTPTYARDLAQAIIKIINTEQKTYGIFHYTNEGATSWYDFAKAIHRAAGITSCKINPIRTSQYPTPAKRPAYSLLDKAKIKQTYNISIPHWQDSLDECVATLLNND
ncbi:MAG: dTDP-4-dehydrorhamnose reductase [Bacteroidaceae bacterium]